MAFKDLDFERKFSISGEKQVLIKTGEESAVYACGPYKGEKITVYGETKIRVIK